MAEDSPAEADIPEEGSVNPGDAVGACIDKHQSLHALQNLLDVGGRIVFRVGTKFEANELAAIFAQSRLAGHGAIVFKEEGIGHGAHDAGDVVGIFFFLLAFPGQFGGTIHKLVEASFLRLALLWSERLVVIGDRHAGHGIAGLAVELGLRATAGLLARREHVAGGGVLTGPDLILHGEANQFCSWYGGSFRGLYELCRGQKRQGSDRESAAPRFHPEAPH